MRVVDTSAWIEWTSETAVGLQLGQEIPDKGRWIVPTVVQYELVRWAKRYFSEAAADTLLAHSTGCLVVPLDVRIAMRAVDCSRAHSLAMADAIIYATALDADADLLTCDAHFADLPSVLYLPKTRP